MNKKPIKNIVLVILFIVLAPLILIGITALGNTLAGKSKNTTQNVTQQAAKVPEENKNTNQNIPKANEEKVSNDNNSNSSNNSTQNQNNSLNNQNSANQDSSRAIAGQSYTVKSGDTLFSIASSAYGESNSQNGVEKIKEANNMQNNNLAVGQKIQIPKL
ncbi:LysM peptidoglycan-binding domain-containing protein [Gemella cuniculi]|uniref:LysM peptidoglycan-binding domain-containing protein n=1 Tax=Gemella cuniculi TaxID=150240 RepID=UPI0004252723|nr:LysM peptidoglycan-binding domain-containing protein [Gemella cuniculi]